MVSGYRVYLLRTRGRVETHRRRGGQIEALRLALDGHRDRLIGQCHQVGRQSPRLIAEHPRGPLAEPGIDAGVIQGASGPPARMAATPSASRTPTATGRWNRLPAEARTHLPLYG